MSDMVMTGTRENPTAMEPKWKLIKIPKIVAAKILAKRLMPQVPNRLTFLPSHPIFGLALFWMLGATTCAVGLSDLLAFHFIQRKRIVVITRVINTVAIILMVLE